MSVCGSDDAGARFAPEGTPLVIEPLPRPATVARVAALASSTAWEALAQKVAAAARGQCEACGVRLPKRRPAIHETFHYDDATFVVTLTGFVALCAACDRVKRLEHDDEDFDEAIEHLCRINGWDEARAEQYIGAVSEAIDRSHTTCSTCPPPMA